MTGLDLSIASLAKAYREGRLDPVKVVAEVYRRIEARGRDHVWTRLVPRDEALARARALEALPPGSLPLYGIPFGVKDNIHVAGLPTTAACAALDQPAAETATLVSLLLAAGAILIGKQNLDQFATGLVGIRSPMGYCRNPFDERYIPGGSSSGSAVAVAAGLVSFSIGSDTGGSGRVPAALNNIVGLKPTPGAISSAGVLHCNRTFDVMPVFASTCDDAWTVYRQLRVEDDRDPYSRPMPQEEPPSAEAPFTFAVPAGEDLTFFGDAQAESLFAAALERLSQIGGQRVPVDYSPFREAGNSVFGGAMLAERLVEFGPVVTARPETIHPAVRQIVEGARRFSAVEAFTEQYRLATLRKKAASALSALGPAGILVVPTTGTIYRCDEVEADPIAKNANMGRYTYFVNPLGLAALAIPAGIRGSGLPFGICLIGPGGSDARLLGIGRRFERALGLAPGLRGARPPA